VPLHQSEDGYLLEDQACNGLHLWAENFASVTVLIPVQFDTAPPSWKPIETVGPNLERIKIVPLPTAYRPDQFFKHYRKIRDIIAQEIDAADYLSFSIGGLFGDWGSVACYQAHRKGRPYAVWTDRVESEVVRRTASSGSFKQRLKARLTYRPMAWLERYLIKRSTLGLFHGKETYDTYAPYCPEPVLVHDIHLRKSEHITADLLKAKATKALDGPLQIGYVGRSDPMKGPLDWIEALSGLEKRGVDFDAFWMGEGSETEAMKARAVELGLQGHVKFLGFVKDRQEVLERYRQAQVFFFCHKTPESPRCLIEALISGTPIVGYSGAFAEDLISGHGGGRLVAMDNVTALTDQLEQLAHDRRTLGELIKAAAKDGAPYDDVSVFKHRSDVIKRHL
jgi:glycosyltransferase involved in cell wall biosynthesis